MIAIRADANAQIGSGHIMRTLALAEELRNQGQNVLFITADDTPKKRIQTAGFKHVNLHTNWADMQGELPTLQAVLQENQVQGMIIDSYAVSDQYLMQVRMWTKTAYLDDFGVQTYPVDVLINYQIFSLGVPYDAMYAGTHTSCLLGTQYVPLRKEFQAVVPCPVQQTLQAILITTGSSDPFGVSHSLMKAIVHEERWKDVDFYFVVGRFYCDVEKLRELAKGHPNLILCEEVTEMAKLMTRCDAAISASGTTLYELCACGLPSVIFSMADNQVKIREWFSKSGIMLDGGEIRVQGGAKLLEQLRLLQPVQMRTKLRINMRKGIDGQGAVRLAQKLTQWSEFRTNRG